MATEEKILAECSDDEEFNCLGISNGSTWVPKLEEVEDLYQKVKKNKFIELTWRCPGRRDPHQPEKPSAEPVKPVASVLRESEADDFDFEDESQPSMLKLPSKSGTPKSTTKKRTTTLAGILSNMERHRIIERLGDKPSPKANK